MRLILLNDPWLRLLLDSGGKSERQAPEARASSGHFCIRSCKLIAIVDVFVFNRRLLLPRFCHQYGATLALPRVDDHLTSLTNDYTLFPQLTHSAASVLFHGYLSLLLLLLVRLVEQLLFEQKLAFCSRERANAQWDDWSLLGG